MTNRVEIEIVGYDKRGSKVGKATRILNGARSQGFILDNVDQVKGSIKVGQCGKHVIKISDGAKCVERIDLARRGSKAAEIGEFVVKQA